MPSDDDKSDLPLDNQPRGFFAGLVNSLARSLILWLSAFAVGTGVSAAVCLYYGVPLVFSLIGGFLVLGIALALMSESLFF